MMTFVSHCLGNQILLTKMLEYVERTVYFLKNVFVEGASSYCVLNEALMFLFFSLIEKYL